MAAHMFVCKDFFLLCYIVLLISLSSVVESNKDFSTTPISHNQGRFSREPIETVPLPNFYAHVVGNRDEYKLIVPKEYQLHQLVEHIPPAITSQYQMRKLSSSTMLPNSANTSSPKSDLDVKTMEATLAALHDLVSGMYNQTTHATGFIRIGNASVPRERVTAVGDIDANGLVDYVVSNVAAKARRGTIRLYLMKPNNEFYYTRELVPGQWGFDSLPLQPGDRFGTVVVALPAAPHSVEYSLLAVGAPGEKNGNVSEAARPRLGYVYIIKVSKKGNVLNNVKLPWQVFQSLVWEYEQAATAAKHPEAGKNNEGFDDPSPFMDAVESARTIVFRGNGGATRATLRIDDADGRRLLRAMDHFIQEIPVSRLERMGFWHPTMRIVMENHLERPSCLFNEKECSCKLEAPVSGCLEASGNPDAEGKFVCKERKCVASYTCSCDGSKTCDRVRREARVLEIISEVASGIKYCKEVTKTKVTNIVRDSRIISSGSTAKRGCVFGEKKCSCDLVASNADCYEASGPANIDGKIPCRLRQCATGYQCLCDGTKICRREEHETQVLRPISGTSTGSQVCESVTRRHIVNTIEEESTSPALKNAAKSSPYPSPSPDFSGLSPFNATHCICSPPAEDSSPTKDCLHYSFTIRDSAVVCKMAQCAAIPGYTCDSIGHHYCERHWYMFNIYLNDGEYMDNPGLVYCHRETFRKERLVRII